MSILKNSKGMSLVGVLVALALTGVLSVILMNLMSQQTKQQHKALLDGELTEIYGQFVRNINHYDSCFASFMGLKKGSALTELRIDSDPNKDPFAEVGKRFRGTKLILSKLRILTDAEVTARDPSLLMAKDPSGFTNVILEVTLDRPEGTLGGKSAIKIFEVAVAMGTGQIINMPSPDAVTDNCKQVTGNDGCIANFDTGICNSNESSWPNDMIQVATDSWYGYCVDATPANVNDDIIFNCTTQK
jgi:hypothetical protein